MQKQNTEINFKGQNIFCGIDVHSKTWVVTVETDQMYLKTFSQPADKYALVRFFQKNYPGANVIAGYEAGYFGFELYRFLQESGIKCKILNPADIPTTHKEKDQKRDPLDSKKIARALRTGDVNSIWIPPAGLQQDRQLLRTRRSLVKDQTRVKNQIKAFLQIYGIELPDHFAKKKSHWSRKFNHWLDEIRLQEHSGTESLQTMIRQLQFIREELLTVSRHIRQLARSDKYKDPYNRLINLSGISTITAMVLLMEVGDVNRFSNTNRFRSFIGFIPRSNSSGEDDYHGRITKRANHHIRSLLVESSWTTVRYDPYYLQLYTQYKKRMKGNRAIVRVAGKLANQIYYCLKAKSE